MLGQLCYLSTILSALHYENDEPLHFVYHLNRIATSKGAELLCQFDEITNSSSETQQSPTSTTITQQTPETIRSLCMSAFAVCILLHLRNYFIESYGLEGRFEGWNINAIIGKTPIKLSKRIDTLLSFTAFPWPDFSSTLWAVSSPQLTTSNFSIDAFQIQIDFFRSLLEGHTVSLINTKPTRKRANRASIGTNAQNEIPKTRGVKRKPRKREPVSSVSDGM
jgi:hypothetical protein